MKVKSKMQRVAKNDFEEKRCMVCDLQPDSQSQKELKCGECE